jgi:hypothetical protein
MKLRQSIFLMIAAAMVAALVACGSSSHPITVAFSPAPPASLQAGASTSLTAVVSNDSAGGGVNWTAACGSADCGGFSSTTTPSGTATTYTAPATIPSGGTVTVKATSVTDATKSVSASITITAATTLADGTYVFSLAGQNFNGQYIYYVAGAFTVASGTITAGEQDFIDYANPTSLTDAISGGTVTTTADGNLQITLTTADNAVGVSGVETLNGTLVSASRALISEFDASATSSGELDLQTSASAGQGGYAFFVNGGDAFGCPSSFGGVVNVDGPGTISGTGSVFDINDACDGVLLTNQPIDPSTVSSPDAFGRVQISLALTTSGVGGIGLVGYIIDGNRIRLVENSLDPNDVFFGVTGGTAFAQGANTGTFTNTSIEGSSFVFGTNGQDINGYFQIAGVLTTNVDGTTVNGTLNFNDLTGTGAQAPLAFTGTYTVDPTGRVTLSNLTDGATFAYNAQLYLDGNGHGTFITVDNTDTVAGYAFPQTGGGSFTAGSFAGNYGMDTTGYGLPIFFGPEFDTIGPATSDGVSAVTGTFDQNILNGAQTPGLTLTDGFSTVDPSGFLTGTMTGLDVTTTTNTGNFSYYLIDTTKVVAIQTDPNQLTLGYFELQQ